MSSSDEEESMSVVEENQIHGGGNVNGTTQARALEKSSAGATQRAAEKFIRDCTRQEMISGVDASLLSGSVS